MQRLIILLFLTFFTALPIMAEDTVLRGSVAYTVESARQFAFEGLELKLNKREITPYIYDENNKENLLALKNNIDPKGRYLMSFEMLKGIVKGYVVVYEDKPDYAYYYTTGGTLVAIDVDNKHKDGEYPYKVGKYSALTGNLISIGLYISEEEQYAYTKSGKLKAHWVGNTGYNAKGKPIAYRNTMNNIPIE